ncbi:MAG: ABC transporter permease [Bacillota bacterium]|jgi:ABC-2 type transport system permease protein
MNGFLLYFRYLRVNFLAGLQYKGWPMQVFSVLFTVVTDPLEVMLLFARFGSIGDWSTERVILVYGLALTSFGLAELFSRGFDYFPTQIRTGIFDRVLLRPRSTFVQIMGTHFHLHRLSRVVGGLFAIVWSLSRQGISVDGLDVLQLLAALLGGYLVYTGIFVISSAVAFWTVQQLDWVNIFTNGSYQVAKVPPNLLPAWLRNTFTFFMPMFICSYYPAAAVCGWSGVPAAWGWLSLPAGAVFFSASLALWRVGVGHYASTGS